MRRLLVGLAALWWPLSSLGAQDSSQVAPGARLRVTAERALLQLPSGTFTTLADPTHVSSAGVYRELTDTTLLLTSGNSTLVIPLRSVVQLERSQGRRPSFAGGVVGFVLGGAAGAGVACLASRDSYGVPCLGGGGDPLVVGVAIGAAAGAALFARMLGRERWSSIEVRQLLVPDP